MNQAFATYKGYHIHHDVVTGYTVEHPTLGDQWFERLYEAKQWIDVGCPHHYQACLHTPSHKSKPSH